MKFIDLNKQYQLIQSNILRDITSVLDKGDFILGEKVSFLENKLANYVGVKECITCASGTDALLIPLMEKNIGQGDAVFTTDFSFFATTEVISLVGATPIFVDVYKDSFNINPDLLESEIIRIKKEGKLLPKAIIAVDLFGQIANYDRLTQISEKYNLFLIEDAAQSFGATANGKKSCSFGNVSATSFYPSKPLGCYGDGGAIFTNDSNLADTYRSIRVHGEGKDKYHNNCIGLNSRLDTLQAAVLLNKLIIFDDELKKRNDIANYYSSILKDYVRIPVIKNGCNSSWAQYSIVLDSKESRNNIVKVLNQKNIPTAIFYKNPFHTLEIYKNNKSDKYPISEKLSKTILSLPMHPYLSKKELDNIISVIRNYFMK